VVAQTFAKLAGSVTKSGGFQLVETFCKCGGSGLVGQVDGVDSYYWV
jgi:hypothetical protein